MERSQTAKEPKSEWSDDAELQSETLQETDKEKQVPRGRPVSAGASVIELSLLLCPYKK